MSGVTVDDTVECDSCGEQFPHWARWLGHREQARANAALDAVRDALASDDPAVVRAMAERVGLTVSESTHYSAVRRDRPTSHSMSGDHDWRGRIASAIARSDYGMSPDTHVLMCAVRTSASVSTWSPWREVPDA